MSPVRACRSPAAIRPRVPCACRGLAVALLILLPPQAAAVDAPASLQWGMRLRHETVDDDRWARQADGNTLRLMLCAESPTWQGWRALMALQAVRRLGPHRFDDAVQAEPDYPRINDPQAEEVGEAYLRWTGAPRGRAAEAWIGRRGLFFDNQRFIGGGPAWRQSWQSFNGVGVRLAMASGPRLELAEVSEVQGPQGNRSDRGRQPLHGHLASLSAPLHPGGLTLAAFGYWLDFGDAQALSSADSTKTFGASASGTLTMTPGASFGYQLVMARQDRYAGGTRANDEPYRAIRLHAAWGGLRADAEFERLGGDGRYGLQTPLAALHFFNGHADRFLVTPRDGLDDQALTLGWQQQGWKLWATWHRYDSDFGNYHYGQEWDLGLALPLPRFGTVMLKFADYRADNGVELARRSPGQLGDTRKLWLQWEYSGRLEFP